MKGFVKFLITVLIAALCTIYASIKGIPALTWGVLCACVVIILILYIANILMYIGTLLYSKNPQKGIALMRVAYKTHRLNPSHQLIFAYLLLRCAEVEEAENVMAKATVIGKHALKEDEFNAVKLNRALITWKKGDLSQAIVQLEELYAAGYRTNGLYGSLGSFYILNKEFDKALELSEEALKADSSNLVALDNKGQSFIGLGMLDEAMKVYEELIPQKPGFLEAYFNYGTILEKRDKLQEAKYNYETALTYDEKYLSTITHDEVCEAIENIDKISIDNVKIEDIVYEGTTEHIEVDVSEELSDIETVEIDIPAPTTEEIVAEVIQNAVTEKEEAQAEEFEELSEDENNPGGDNA